MLPESKEALAERIEAAAKASNLATSTFCRKYLKDQRIAERLRRKSPRMALDTIERIYTVIGSPDSPISPPYTQIVDTSLQNVDSSKFSRNQPGDGASTDSSTEKRSIGENSSEPLAQDDEGEAA